MSGEWMQYKIEKAQKEIDEKREQIQKGKMRQRYHFMGETGWINDPNGLIYFRGKYHYFFQFNPYSGFWDSMHWGHAVSSDLVHWEYLPLALAPSEAYDDYQKGGCFSGSAIEHDGKLYLIYTGAAATSEGVVQTQCVAWSEDGIHFEKYANNPVITAPEGISKDLFRDPKVWRQGDTFYLVCGAGCAGRGQALLYRSGDLLHWEYVNVLAESRGEWGFMWECPDFFPMNDKHVLTISPMGSGDHTSMYFVGDFDETRGRFYPQSAHEMDWGFDYYAPQSFTAPDGRRITVGWSNGWEWMPIWKDWGPTYREGWSGWFNLPREVRMDDDGQLQFIPVEELQALRYAPVTVDAFSVGEDGRELRAGDGIAFEMKFQIDLEQTDADLVEVVLREGAGRCALYQLDLKNGEIRLDRNNADGWSRGVSRSGLLLKGKKMLDVHLYSDQSSLEIFADRYKNNHSSNVFAPDEQCGIRIRTSGGTAVIRGYESFGLKECFRR